ncbi:alpha/beta fold hydrolase [Shewanella sp. D64]|uniref:alpha/beta fold hydrolase n=1 Tax=unclassified Shewanella TaxID=196818 RepID=UPI0022BA192B|nr:MULTISPECIES: alpha/beta fold hydrolase [unclassified Shewanella]MEC4725900.1 alpha/beta fold hydrolase [Shewanella sp. D64]MEC4737155.1 alpha/beta fold hydrolase [Shewanella sp. E94]WBJ95653.1 alpha/beta fold hydrolase [Shewanella sp. MTB7]
MSLALDPQDQSQIEPAPLTFSSEQALNTLEQQVFWKTVTQSVIKTLDNITLAYAYIEHPQSDKAIVISNGRVESYLKYQELIFDLYHQGYSIYAIDHRGQGLSSRTTTNPQQGHIDKFDTYIDDFAYFIDNVVLPKQHKMLFLVGHSMGGAIGTLYLDKHPQTFKAAVFSAPMYGIKLPVSRRFIRWLAKILDTTSEHREPNYILGGKDYDPEAFANNDLTHSQLRYEDYRILYQAHPELQLGSPTNHWLYESIDAGEKTIAAAKRSTTPILILQAEQDTIVDNFAQYHTVNEQCQLISIPNARHEIFMEQDESRNLALTELINFLQKHSS